MTPKDHLRDRELALGIAIQDFATDLRLVDPADLVTFVRMEQYANIEDLVNSSSELLFKPSTLTFGWGADMRVTWTETPCVSLDMEFRHASVTVFFALGLRAESATVEIRYICFEAPLPDPSLNTLRLVEALNASRCVAPRT
ncbi:MAG: hypothetical protein JWL62_1721 [Hyphomicrobiales bacterium]|jgi:hypothetical protein|nr:hypothetical protein [Hyphomicrobiales bacterium]